MTDSSQADKAYQAVIEECCHGQNSDVGEWRETLIDRAIAEAVREHKERFDRGYAADMRAIQEWRAAHPEEPELVWPTHERLIVWLLDNRDRAVRDQMEADAKIADNYLTQFNVDGPWTSGSVQQSRHELRVVGRIYAAKQIARKIRAGKEA